MAPLVAAAREAGDVPHELTFEMKRQLNENAALLSSKDLYGMVGIVEENCKAAVDQSNPAEVCRAARPPQPLLSREGW